MRYLRFFQNRSQELSPSISFDGIKLPSSQMVGTIIKDRNVDQLFTSASYFLLAS